MHEELTMLGSKTRPRCEFVVFVFVTVVCLLRPSTAAGGEDCAYAPIAPAQKGDENSGLLDYLTILLMSSLLFWPVLFNLFVFTPRMRRRLMPDGEDEKQGRRRRATIVDFREPVTLNKAGTVVDHRVVVRFVNDDGATVETEIRVHKEVYERSLTSWRALPRRQQDSSSPPPTTPVVVVEVRTLPGRPNAAWSGDLRIVEYTCCGKLACWAALVWTGSASAWVFLDYCQRYCVVAFQLVLMILVHVFVGAVIYPLLRDCEFEPKWREMSRAGRVVLAGDDYYSANHPHRNSVAVGGDGASGRPDTTSIEGKKCDGDYHRLC